jgi:DNA-binding NarL/FixJ family response regulator
VDADGSAYAALALDVERVACGLLELGVAKGDAIALWAPASPRRRLVQLASARIGAVLVTLDGDWQEDALRRVLAAQDARLLVTSSGARADVLRALRAGPGPAMRLVLLDGPPHEGEDVAFGELLVAGTAIEVARLRARGATPWAARARAGRRAAGVDAGPLSAAGGLTERERQVAEAAAAGRTNKEIAAQLFLSSRTVELHLSAAFRKLGVRRRAELAARLDASDDAPTDGADVAAHVVRPISAASDAS